MAKATWIGEGETEVTTLHGTEFKAGKSVDVSEDVAIRLMGNPFFKLNLDQATKDKAADAKAEDDAAIAKRKADADAESAARMDKMRST